MIISMESLVYRTKPLIESLEAARETHQNAKLMRNIYREYEYSLSSDFSLPSAFNASLALCAFSFESCENSCGARNKSSGLERRGWKKEGEGGQDFNKNFARSSRGGDERWEEEGGELGISRPATLSLSLLSLPPTPRVQGVANPSLSTIYQ